MMKNIERMVRKGEKRDQTLLEQYALGDWIQTSWMIIVYSASDSAFSIAVDTRTGNFSSMNIDPISRTPISPFSHEVVAEIFRRLEEVDRENLTDKDFLSMVQEAHDFIADTSRVIR